MSGRPSGLRSRTLLVIVVLYLIGSAVLVLSVRGHMRGYVLEDARERADLLISQSLATHAFMNQELKPDLFDLTEEILDEEAFIPSWMSSTYAIRRIGTYADGGLDGYYYKECAIDARSPENEADGYEREFLHAVNADPALEESSGTREIDGEKYYYLLQRGEVMEESCLQCHSTPAAAPAGLVEVYGPERSFGRSTGEVVSALSIRVPLDVAYAEADQVAGRLTTILLAVLLVLLAATYLFMNREVVRPLALVASTARKMAARTRGLRDGVGRVAGSREIEELTSSIDALAIDLDHRIAELQAAREDLETANMARDRFLANLSHELRTPLNSIIGFAGTLRSELAGPVTCEQAAQLDMIKNSGTHLLGLVEELLEFSALYAGVERVMPGRFSPSEVISGVARMFRPAAEEKGIALEILPCADDREAYTDRFKLEQILINLVSNALKFTSEGSVTISCSRTAGDLVVEVADTGRGIPDECLESVFDEFSQVSASDGSKPSGTGLGLSIARAHTRLLGGDVVVRSEVGRGSTFVVRVPLEYRAIETDTAGA